MDTPGAATCLIVVENKFEKCADARLASARRQQAQAIAQAEFAFGLAQIGGSHVLPGLLCAYWSRIAGLGTLHAWAKLLQWTCSKEFVVSTWSFLLIFFTSVICRRAIRSTNY